MLTSRQINVSFIMLLLMVGILLCNEFGNTESLLDPNHTNYPKQGKNEECLTSILRPIKSAGTDLQVLGPSNAWALSKFLCSLDNERYALVDFSKQGTFFPYYQLQLENSHGVGVAIILKKLQIRQDLQALVGVRVSDPLTTRALDVLAWQQLVQQMVSTEPKPASSSR